jgi:hypothetical protein
MKRRSRNTIKLDWVNDIPFRVRLNRVVPKARRAPEAFADFFVQLENLAWQTPAFLV